MKRYREIYYAMNKSKVRARARNKFFVLFVAILVVLSLCVGSVFAYFTSRDNANNIFSIKAEYTVIFHANNGTQTTSSQSISYNVATNLNQNQFTYQGYVFNGWNTEANGSGTPYTDGQEVLDLVGNNESIDLYAQWQVANGVAEINGSYFESLQAAIDTVDTDDVNVVIRLLQDTDEHIVISEHQNITINLNNHSVTNDKQFPTVSNDGTLTLYGGSIYQNSTSAGAIDNQSTGTLIVDSVRVEMIKTGGKQALYNDGGICEIKGTSYLKSISTIRATVQNQALGTMKITGGTIIATGFSAVTNNGSTITIGVKDGNVDKTSPVIQSPSYALNIGANSYEFYDGVLRGKTAISQGSGTYSDIETGKSFMEKTQVIDGVTYHVAYLAKPNTITLDMNDGSGDTSTLAVEDGEIIETIPTPIRTGFEFMGWYSLAEGGDELDPNGTYNSDTTYYAHWEVAYTAQINGTKYLTLQEAINAVDTDNVQVVITILNDTKENVSIAKNKNIKLDIQNHTIRNDGVKPVIENFGRLEIDSGTITSDTTQGAINNKKEGTLIMTGGTVRATGTRQAIYNDGGRTEISGTTYLSATTTERATVQNLNSGTLIITGGTIVSSRFSAVVNASGTCIIGVKDDDLDNTSPVMQGKTYGINNSSTLKFYNGIAKGMTNAINGSIADKEDNSAIYIDSETIDGNTYETAYLKLS